MSRESIFPGWMCGCGSWRYYGPLLYSSVSYAEFKLRAEAAGYVNPDTARRLDPSLDISDRLEPYERFVFETACGHNGKGLMNEKARVFREQMREGLRAEGLR